MTKIRFLLFSLIILLAFIFGLKININHKSVIADNLSFDEQEASIRAIQKVKPAVVSITIYMEEKESIYDTKTKKIKEVYKDKKQGSGTGFLISPDGFILTNKHVIKTLDRKRTSYKIKLNDNRKYYAQYIGKDPLNDLAVLKIYDKNLPYVELGDSDKLQVGQSVIAIGNVLGIYQNSVTKGIISALNRNILATNQYSFKPETLNNVIQTDAEINFGNSGGPLIDLEGKVVGVNVAIDESGSAIGFSIPINDAKIVIKTIRTIGRIVIPRLGVRYIMIDDEIAKEKNLKINYGALIVDDENKGSGVVKNSPADKAGLKNGDIIFEINAIKINHKNKLSDIIKLYKPRDKIGLKIKRGDKVFIRIVELDEFKS